MEKIIHEIAPKNLLANYLVKIVIVLGITLIILSFIFPNYSGLAFVGVLTLSVGGLIYVFSAQKYLRITNKQIVFESKSIVMDFGEKITINFDEIADVKFLRKQLIRGGRLPNDDADVGMHRFNRMAFSLKNYKVKLILQVGDIDEFTKSYELIKSIHNKIKATPKDLKPEIVEEETKRYFLKCEKCEFLTEIEKTNHTWCPNCTNQFPLYFKKWKIANPNKSIEAYKREVCIAYSVYEVKKNVYLNNEEKEIKNPTQGLIVRRRLVKEKRSLGIKGYSDKEYKRFKTLGVVWLIIIASLIALGIYLE